MSKTSKRLLQDRKIEELSKRIEESIDIQKDSKSVPKASESNEKRLRTWRKVLRKALRASREDSALDRREAYRRASEAEGEMGQKRRQIYEKEQAL